MSIGYKLTANLGEKHRNYVQLLKERLGYPTVNKLIEALIEEKVMAFFVDMEKKPVSDKSDG